MAGEYVRNDAARKVQYAAIGNDPGLTAADEALGSMMRQLEPWPGGSPVDAWSTAIWLALRHWSIEKGGSWRRWEPGYLVLTVDRANGHRIDPVDIDTANQELTVSFGGWATHDPTPDGVIDRSPECVAHHALHVAQRWLDGRTRTAVAFDSSDKWIGSTILKDGPIEPQLRTFASWLRTSAPQRIEVRAADPQDRRRVQVRAEWLAG